MRGDAHAHGNALLGERAQHLPEQEPQRELGRLELGPVPRLEVLGARLVGPEREAPDVRSRDDDEVALAAERPDLA
jgi:hypothetical protein